MKSNYLLKWQSISLVSRIMAMALGIIQSLVIVNVLTPGEWGTIRIVASIASFIGVSQAIGLTSGSTREISASKNKDHAFKVFITSLTLRVIISLPFAVFLWFAAPYLASNRDNAGVVIWALRMMSVVLIIQSTQGIFNSVISGFKRFNVLFTYQVAIAVLSLLIYIPLVYFFSFKGYYYAYFLLNIVAAITLCVLALKNFSRPFPKFTYQDTKEIVKDVFSISIVVYMVKLLYTFWLESPILYLNYVLGVDEVVIAVFGFALFYATKLMVFSDAITDVTLPVMSKAYTTNVARFKSDYQSNFKKTFLVITFVAAVVAFWNSEVINLVVKREEYRASTFIIPLIILGIWAYSQINLYKSSVFVPAKKLTALFSTYVLMTVLVFVCLYIFTSFNTFSYTVSLALAFGVGTTLAFFIATFIIRYSLKLNLLTSLQIYYTVISAVYLFSYYLIPDVISKGVVTILYFFVSYFFFKKAGVLNFIYRILKK